MSLITVSFGIFLLSAAIWDIGARKVPNALILIGIVAAVCLHALQSGWDGIWKSLIAAIAAALPAIAIYMTGAIGAGDAKWFAGAGGFLGMQEAITLFVAAIFVSAVIALLAPIISARSRDGLRRLLYECCLLYWYPSVEDARKLARWKRAFRFPFMTSVLAAWFVTKLVPLPIITAGGLG